jgi:malonyl-CoA/methylmalonyl-CoA synthetase
VGLATPAQGGDVLIHALPIFHVHGLFVACHGALLNGSRMIWFAKFDPKAVIARAARGHRVHGRADAVRAHAGRAGPDAGSLPEHAALHQRLGAAAAGDLPDWQQRTGHTILERYGMSETVMLTSNPYAPASGRRGGTVGFPLPGVGVRVCDDQGLPMAAGDIGGIEVKGPNVFQGYWRMPEKTADEFTNDGWFKTGDVGRIDADGYVTIVGRSKDLIISGGYNVYPAEIEGYLNDMPGVAESAVVGVPHADFGEAVIAVVVAKPGAALDAQA